MIASLAGARSWNDTRERWLHRAAQRSGLSDRTIKALFYGEIVLADHPAVGALRKAAKRYETQNLADRVDELARSVRILDSSHEQAGEPCLPLSKAR